jgi:hypothetical protein
MESLSLRQKRPREATPESEALAFRPRQAPFEADSNVEVPEEAAAAAAAADKTEEDVEDDDDEEEEEDEVLAAMKAADEAADAADEAEMATWDTTGSRDPEDVEISTRIVGKNQYASPVRRFPTTRHAATWGSFAPRAYELFADYIDTNFFCENEEAMAILSTSTVPHYLMQETGDRPHNKAHTRWVVLASRRRDGWLRWYRCNVLEGTAKELFIELHIGWSGEGDPAADWKQLFKDLALAGRGLATMEPADLTLLVEEGDGVLKSTAPTTQSMFPERGTAKPEFGCKICQVAAREANGGRRKRAFRKLGEIYAQEQASKAAAPGQG